MNKNTPIRYASGVLVMFWTAVAAASSPYFNAVTNLHPVGYWPMHEVTAPAPGDIETNYGTLGVLGTGYYPDWANGPGAAILHQVPGLLTASGDSDTAAYFSIYNGNTYTNALLIPHTSPASTLTPPFSVECWFYTTNAASVGNDVWSQCGLSALNSATGSGTPTVGGIRLFGSGSAVTLYTYDGTTSQNNQGSISTLTANHWYHVVVTCDAQTNFSLYVNGNSVFVNKAAVGKYTPDVAMPFEVGTGRGNTRTMDCFVDELAIYTNVLANISTHYNDGLAGSASAYFHDVTNDGPVIYLRMNGGWNWPAATTWPVLTNYGTVAANGAYTPGTMPGVVSGPVNPSSVPFTGVSGTVPQFSGVSSFADAGYAPAYNPVGAVPFTVSALFRGNPTDGRVQTIVGHSDSSWQIALNTSGKLQCQLGTNSPSQIISSGVYNDGNWHQVIEVYSPASNPALTGTNSLYVDGVLDTAVSTVTPNGILPGSPSDVLLAGDPQYTNTPAGVGRQFAGQVCEVALFTNALSASQVRGLFDALGESLPAFIRTQPKLANNNGTFVFSVGAGGTSPLAYQWYSNTSSNYAGATALSDGGGVSGSTNANLTIADLSAYYFVVVTNAYGVVTSTVVSAANASPLFTSQFPTAYSNMWLFPGFNHTLSIAAVGAPPLYFRWFTNGVPMGSLTSSGSPLSSSLSLTNVQAAFANDYCVVSNALGSSTSFVWSASIVSPPSSYARAVAALNPLGYWRLNEPDDNLSDGNPFAVCHDYVGGNNGLYTNVYLGLPGYNPATDPTDTSVQVGSFSSANSYAGFVGANVDFSVPNGGSAQFSVEAWVSLPSTSNGGIVTKGWGGGGEEFSLDTANSHRYFEFLVRTAFAQTAGAIAAVSTITPQDGVWYHLVGVCDQVNGKLLLYVNGTLAATATLTPGIGIVNSSTWPLTIGARAANQDSDSNGYTVQSHGYINDVAVFNYVLSSNQVVNEYLQAGIPPSITQQPTGSYQGGNMAISVAATGTPPLAYQWYFNTIPDYNGATPVTDGNGVSGSTNATLVLTNALAYYFAVVTNNFGSVTSLAARVASDLTLVSAGKPIWNQGAATNIVVIFSDILDPVTATTVINYSLDNGANVLAAALGGSNEVVLTTSVLNPSIVYTLTVQNVKDVFGIPMSPSPASISVGSYPAVAVWVRADSGVNTDANGVVLWNDLSGYGNSFFSSYGPPFEPQLATNALGDPVVHFTGGDGTLMAAFDESTLEITGDLSIFAVVNFATLAGNTNGMIASKTSGSVAAPYDYYVRSDGVRLYRGNGTAGGQVSSASVPSTAGTHLLGVVMQGTTVNHRLDGRPNGSGTLSATIADTAQPLYIGQRADGVNRLSGDLSELIIVGSALSSYGVSSLESYLISRNHLPIVPVNTHPTNILFSASANRLTLSWPSDHTGWRLQAQTNNLPGGLSTNWVNVSGSSSTNQVILPIDSTKGSVFYRLVYP